MLLNSTFCMSHFLLQIVKSLVFIFSFHFLYHSQSVLTRHFVIIRFYTCKARHKVLWNLNSLTHTHTDYTNWLHTPSSASWDCLRWNVSACLGLSDQLRVQTILIFFLLSPCVHLLIAMSLYFSSCLFPPSFPLPIFSLVWVVALHLISLFPLCALLLWSGASSIYLLSCVRCCSVVDSAEGHRGW